MECIELFMERIMESLIPTIISLVITISISITKSWVVVQAMSAICLIFTCALAYNGIITAGSVVLFHSYFPTIRDANKIVVLEQGKMVECGTFDELKDKKGKFYELKQLSELTGGNKKNE